VRYSISFYEPEYRALVEHLFADRANEQAGYLLCKLSSSSEQTRLLVREFMPVRAEDVLGASAGHMEIRSTSFMRAMKRADQTRHCFIFVHSHPSGVREHSRQDDVEEKKLFETAYVRIGTPGVHASLVLSDPERPVGRVWLPDGRITPVDCVRIIGDRFRFYRSDSDLSSISPIYDRQVRAFGEDFQRIIKSLNIGIVGTGGTGSAVAEQLIRLGVGTLSLFEGQAFESTNVTRLYGSRLIDCGIPKVKIIERLAADIGMGTHVKVFPSHITNLASARALRECDVIFCCTDDEQGRAILCLLAVYYYLPVIDMGVKIDSSEGVIHSVQGRETVLLPGAACLFCRGRISAEGLRAQAIQEADPQEADRLRQQGYAPELQENAPAVIAFTTTVAASAILEFIQRITGFMGSERKSTEVIHFFDQCRVRTNAVAPQADCFCGDKTRFGRGDVQPFLDRVWPQ
jgi:molybdopterin/thiamine biosynthesis adenylyltransferase